MDDQSLFESQQKLQQLGLDLVGRHSSFMKVLELVVRVADTDSTILLTGETGTGKEVIAQALHLLSPRATRPFVPVNCTAIPESLLESELFGFEKGAFTGAIRSRTGRFAAASSGTIFLDEIGDMPIFLQSKLLRVVESKTVEPVGSERSQKVDVRIVAATNKELEEEVEKGNFRKDLYYRLNVVPVSLPPLRDRIEDLTLLIDYFRVKFNESKRRNVEGLSDQVMDSLRRYPWPGNVRELENLVERLVVVKADGMVEIDDLPERYGQRAQPRWILGDFRIQLPEEGLDLRQVMSTLEADLIDQAIERFGGNKNQAAKTLGMNRTTLVERLRKRERKGQAR